MDKKIISNRCSKFRMDFIDLGQPKEDLRNPFTVGVLVRTTCIGIVLAKKVTLEDCTT